MANVNKAVINEQKERLLLEPSRNQNIYSRDTIRKRNRSSSPATRSDASPTIGSKRSNSHHTASVDVPTLSSSIKRNYRDGKFHDEGENRVPPPLDTLHSANDSPNKKSNMDEIDPPITKHLKSYTREELERLVLKQICLSIRERGVTSELERKLKETDEILNCYRQRIEMAQQQCSVLELVVRKFVHQNQNGPNDLTQMTRSVGLQYDFNPTSETTQRPASMQMNDTDSNGAQQAIPHDRTVAHKRQEKILTYVNPSDTKAIRSSAPSTLINNSVNIITVIPPDGNNSGNHKNPQGNVDMPTVVRVHATTSNETNNSHLSQMPKSNQTSVIVAPRKKQIARHPAPLPTAPDGPTNPAWKPIAPQPTLSIKRVANGIVLSWNMQGNLSNYANIASYQLFSYQEDTDQSIANGSIWKFVGNVKALSLPIACTLTQFLEGYRYHFAVRALDVHGRPGPFSDPVTI